MSAAEKDLIRDAVDKIETHANVTFVETAVASAEIVFAGSASRLGGGASGTTYFFAPQDPVQVWAHDDNLSTNNYIYKHETLHALGLDHSTMFFGNNTNPIPNDEAVGTTLFGNWPPGFGFGSGDYQLFDVAALQYLYGPPPGLRAGNDTYTLNPAAFNPAGPQSQWPLLSDAGGLDTLDYSAFTVPVNISLTPAELSRINGATGGILDPGIFSINYRTVIENANGGSGNDTLTGNDVANALNGGGGNDVLDGRAGADTMTGGAGNDTYIVDNASDVVIEGAGDAADLVRASLSYTLAAGVQVDRLETTDAAGTAAIHFNGNEFAQTLVGNAAGNILDGRGGTDTMAGGAGNDSYIVDNAGDVVVEVAGDTADLVRTSVSYVLSAAAAIEVLRTASAARTTPVILTGNGFGQSLFGNAGHNGLNGGGGNDRLDGAGGNDKVSGGIGNDALNGGLGNDRLDGGVGVDAMRGGGGNDTYIVNTAGDKAIEAGGQGIDRLFTSASFALSAGSHVEILQTANAAATARINLTGNQLVNTLIGNAGANSLNGKGGADTMRGLRGNDSFSVDNARDKVLEVANQGTDTLNASVDYQLQASSAVEILRTVGATATAGIDLTGNALRNTIVGNAGSNIINGGGGKDVLTGGGGNDFFLFNSALSAISNVDTIADFNRAADTVRLDNAIFKAFGATTGTLASGQFFQGAHAHDADDRIVYNSATRALLSMPTAIWPARRCSSPP